MPALMEHRRGRAWGRGMLPRSHSELDKGKSSCVMSMLSIRAVQNASHSLRVSFQHLKYG